MPATKDIEEVHQAIGEFVVFFQSVEDMYREIGWFLVDPSKTVWPPRTFRKESNCELVNKVTEMVIELTRQYKFPDGLQTAKKTEDLRNTFHDLRKIRNRVVHSAYHEVLIEDQILEIRRSNPKITVDPDTGDIEFDREAFDPDSIRREIGRHAFAFITLHNLRTQLKNWYPFTRFERMLAPSGQ